MLSRYSIYVRFCCKLNKIVVVITPIFVNDYTDVINDCTDSLKRFHRFWFGVGIWVRINSNYGNYFDKMVIVFGQ